MNDHEKKYSELVKKHKLVLDLPFMGISRAKWIALEKADENLNNVKLWRWDSVFVGSGIRGLTQAEGVCLFKRAVREQITNIVKINSNGTCTNCKTKSIEYGIDKGSYTYFCHECKKELTKDEVSTDRTIKNKLKYLKNQIEKECISYGEIAELQSLAKHIDSGDTILLEWAGVPEKTN